MQEDEPKSLVGFDPSPLYKTQFDFINHFVRSDIVYELLGVEHLEFYEEKFDTIFCLGVLYHRSDPVAMLKSLFRGLEKQGEVIIDTFYIDGEEFKYRPGSAVIYNSTKFHTGEPPEFETNNWIRLNCNIIVGNNNAG